MLGGIPTSEVRGLAPAALVLPSGTACGTSSVVEVTCSACRHVVEVEPGRPGKCGNCGATVGGAPPFSAPAEVAWGLDAVPPGPPTTPPGHDEPGPGFAAGEAAALAGPVAVTRTASIVAFVCALLFFIPIVTQVVAITAALFAVVRARKPGERRALAWIGLAVAVLILPAWIFLIGLMNTSIATTRAFIWVPPTAVATTTDLNKTSELADEMKRVARAAAAYRRDFDRWPQDVAALVGRSLPRNFRLAPELTYHIVPDSMARDNTWILLSSSELNNGMDSEALDVPHRLLVDLVATVSLVPATEAASTLATQQARALP